MTEVEQKLSPDNRDAIIEKQKELIKAWEDLSVISGASKYLRMIEKIAILESELSALEAPPDNKIIQQ